jgi:peptidyl-prolyl cis-trans isomerase D
MLSFFRRHLSSWGALAILGIVMIAFIVTGVGTPGGGITGGASEAEVARVGSTRVMGSEIATRIEGELRRAREQQPTATAAQLIAAAGGLDAIVNQTIGGKLIEEWARNHGITANERLIGGEIASIPVFQGPTGKFDERQMASVLGQQRMSLTALHDNIRDSLIRNQIVAPIITATRASLGLATPYAALLLDRREGAIGTVPARRDGLPVPTDADVATWYRAHIASYSLPERRVLQYALMGPENVQIADPSEAEIAAAYKADAAKYAASETRTVSRVVLPDEAAARAFVAKAKSGPFAKAAADAGFTIKDISLGSVTRDALATATSPAVAAAVYALPKDGTTAPVKTDLGWTVAHVDALVSTPARSLDSVRAEIVDTLTKKKRVEGASLLVEKVQNAIDGGTTFDDAVKQNRLTVVTTPPLLANGSAPTVPDYRPDATVTALLKAGFDASQDDDPSIEAVGADQHAALLKLANVVPSAPLPLAEIRARVAEDLTASRAADRAKAQAQTILAKLNGGATPAAAFAAAGLPAPQAAAATQLDLSRMQGGAPAPLRALFRLTVGKNELVAAPGGTWFVVHLDRIVPGDSAALPALARAVQGDLGRTLGEEYVQQFANAARADIKVRKNPAGIGALAKQLSGASPTQ